MTLIIFKEEMAFKGAIAKAKGLAAVKEQEEQREERVKKWRAIYKQ